MMVRSIRLCLVGLMILGGCSTPEPAGRSPGPTPPAPGSTPAGAGQVWPLLLDTGPAPFKPYLVAESPAPVDPDVHLTIFQFGAGMLNLAAFLDSAGVELERDDAGNRVVADSAELRRALSAYLEVLALQEQVSSINLQNAGGAGYKRARVVVTRLSPVLELDTEFDLSPGPLTSTQRPLDLAIDGDGFFQVAVGSGTTTVTGYTRIGALGLSDTGELVLAMDEGALLLPAIRLPEDATEVTVTRSGEVRVLRDGTDVFTDVGQIELARFPRGEKLSELLPGIYVATEAAGRPLLARPLDKGMGEVVQGSLEAGNVDPVAEQRELASTTRAAEIVCGMLRELYLR